MPYWSTETLRTRIPEGNLISGYCPENVKHCAYELAVGSAALVTNDGKPAEKKLAADGEPVAIPPGQFALVLTEETVAVPTNAIAFISIRASIKFQGLINVSGFHVDPGYRDPLKFSIYNAGGRTIHLKRGDRIFMIWYADLDRETTDGYGGSQPKNQRLTSDDHNRMEGEVASPGQLKKDIQEIRTDLAVWKGAVVLLTGIAVTLSFRQCPATSTTLPIATAPTNAVGSAATTATSSPNPSTTNSQQRPP